MYTTKNTLKTFSALPNQPKHLRYGWKRPYWAYVVRGTVHREISMVHMLSLQFFPKNISSQNQGQRGLYLYLFHNQFLRLSIKTVLFQHEGGVVSWHKKWPYVKIFLVFKYRNSRVHMFYFYPLTPVLKYRQIVI